MHTRKLKNAAILLVFVALTAAAMAFKPKTDKTAPAATSETCTDWQQSSSTYIRMKWCKDDMGETGYKFQNGYDAEVHFWFEINCSDSKTYTGNIILDGGAESYGGDMMKSIPSNWHITKKEKKVGDGKWVQF